MKMRCRIGLHRWSYRWVTESIEYTPARLPILRQRKHRVCQHCDKGCAELEAALEAAEVHHVAYAPAIFQPKRDA